MYHYAQWWAKRSARETVVELTVVGGVPNITEHIEEVSVRRCCETIEMLYPPRLSGTSSGLGAATRLRRKML
jgi:hypothetical protein